MHRKWFYPALSIHETSLIVGLEQGKALSQIATDLDITQRSAACMLKKLFQLYQCNNTETLLKNLQTHYK